jgi:serine/threonine-protein kinase RsbW
MMYERFIKLIIESKIDNIALLSKAVQAICSTVVNDAVMLYNIELCLVEAVSNVINHAYHRKPGNNVEVTVKVHDHHVIFQIIDNGDKAFPPVPKQELDYDSKDITTWPESGMGLFLIYRIMDEVSFSEHEGKNVLMMKKNLD